MKKIALVTAAVLGIGFSVSVAVSPTLANYVSSFFNKDLDKGVQDAVDMGYAKEAEASATDQGIIIKVADVMADPARIIVSFQLEDTNGKKWSQHILNHKENKIYVTDEDGNVVADRISYFLRNDDYGYYQLMLAEDTPKQLKLHLEVKKLETRVEEAANEFMDGNWNITVPIDMEKSMAASKTVPLSKTITTTPGLTIIAKSIAYTPSAARLTLETTWSEEAQKRIDGFAKQLNATEQDLKTLKAYELNYRIMDNAGNEIVSTSRRSTQEQSPLYESIRKVTENGIEKDVYDIVFIPSKQQGEMTFELDGITLQEPSQLAIPIEANALAKAPVVEEREGLRVTIKSMSMEQEPESEKMMPALRVQEEYKDYPLREWYLTDDQNRSYPLKSVPVPCKVTSDSTGDTLTVCERTLFAKGMDQLPKKAKLQLRLEAKSYETLDWQLALPLEK
ncbi:DUF4179 domain-containing protein [Brevibacillus ruminantium]|uniref:DUF4179 domain-containing protein n=1 Tax=Brevibacillus ruminantium TaxID=2950604 RepID=A0ABY4WA25_9BACL|nr:DUF4179 domain-containing protein [Brevibacillus ruminantium]USG63774.1 DUF4179 domain-containing protein [Brevibacillus ruminantium]